MLGVPVEHHDRFRSLIEENAAVVEPLPTPEQIVMADKASAERRYSSRCRSAATTCPSGGR
jgi:hypothetical protein